VSQSEGRPLPPGSVPEVPAIPEKKKSSSSSGSSSSSDSSSDSSDDDPSTKPMLIIPQNNMQLQAQVKTPPPEDKPDSQLVVQNLAAWSTLNTAPEAKPISSFVTSSPSTPFSNGSVGGEFEGKANVSSTVMNFPVHSPLVNGGFASKVYLL